MSTLFVPSSSSLVQFHRSQSLLLNHNRNALASLLSTTNSRFPLPRRRSITHNDRNSSFTYVPWPVIQRNFDLGSWTATVGENVEVTTTPTSVPVRVAHELPQAGHRYLAVRTPEEFGAGHAVEAINIPYMFRLGSGMTKNPNFVDEVPSHFRKDDEIIVLGKRSLMAVTDLLSAGFTGVIDIAGGFAAWSQNELPIEL